MYYKMQYNIGVNIHLFMLEKRKMNILLCAKVYPRATAPKKGTPILPLRYSRGAHLGPSTVIHPHKGSVYRSYELPSVCVCETGYNHVKWWRHDHLSLI